MPPRAPVALLLLALLGCDRAAPEPTTPPPPPPSPVVDADTSIDAAEPSVDAAVPLDAPDRPPPPSGPFDAGGPADPRRSCSIITHLQRRSLARVSQQLDASLAPVASLLRGCHPTRRGAWGLVLEDACPTSYPITFDDSDETVDLAARVVVAHVDAAGTVTTFVPDAYLPASLSNCPTITHEAPSDALGRFDSLATLVHVAPASTFDFDGDGDEEFIVRFARRSPQDHPEESGVSLHEETATLILKATPDGLIELPGTAETMRVEDVDHDGRPDLRQAFPYGFHPLMDWDTPLVTLVAHSLPGGVFSSTDAVAAHATLAQCAPLRRVAAACPDAGAACDAGAARLALIVRNSRGHVDITASQNQVICAALRGVSSQELGATLNAECAATRSEQRRCSEVTNTAAWTRTNTHAFPAESMGP